MARKTDKIGKLIEDLIKDYHKEYESSKVVIEKTSSVLGITLPLSFNLYYL